MKTKQSILRFLLDGRITEINFSTSNYQPSTTVLNFLRSLQDHKGVKEGCAEGDCGACTIVVAEPGDNGKLIYRIVNSCLMFLPMLHGKQLITVENLAINEKGGKILHPVQQLLLENNGTQCGYCTPGLVMTLFGLYKNYHNPTREVIEEALAGNLCRCTGYQPILAAAGEICRLRGEDHFSIHEPETLTLLHQINSSRESLILESPDQCYYKPFKLEDALHIRKEHPEAIIIHGATDLAVKQTKKREKFPTLLDLSDVEELKNFSENEDRVTLGAGLSLEQVRKLTRTKLPPLHSFLRFFGSLQIRNRATLGGNIASASPIGDTIPLLFAYKAILIATSLTTTRRIPIETFITGYHRNMLEEDEILTAVEIRVPPDGCRIGALKVSKRMELDISTVSCGYRLHLKAGKTVEIILAFGGMAPVVKRAFKTEDFLIGKPWTHEVILEAMPHLADEFTPIGDARAGALYRKLVARNLLLKLYAHPSFDYDSPVPLTTLRVSKGQTGHVTGESVFVNDLPDEGQALTGRVVYSPHPHAAIRSIDVTRARNVPGVKAVILAADIPGQNQMGPVIHDEPCLAVDKVEFIGQAVALIAATSEEAAWEAERQMEISYELLKPILSLDEAIRLNRLIAPERTIKRGNAPLAMEKAAHVLSGILNTGAQEHWYLETQTAMAVPGEGVEMKVFASSQNPSETQAVVAEVLGINKNEVEVEVKRIGGGFGGKETQGNHVAAWSALLARSTGRPVRIHLFRDDDQIITGKRHRFLSRYRIGFDDEGKILAYEVELNADAGAATDLTRAILERAMLHAENSYYIPDISVIGRAWKTNLPSNTAFRGFGGPQGIAVIENAIERVAFHLGKDSATIRQINFYQNEKLNITPYGEEVVYNHLSLLYDQLIKTSGYFERRQAILKFNQEHEFFKKGIAITPVKFGISFTTAFLNQGGALVNIYNDGTVLVNHGGTEMGQGLHGKIRLIAANELGVSPDFIKINATNTSKVPNTSATAASSGSDINGMAVKNAIEILKSRLTALVIKEFSSRFPGEDSDEAMIVFENNTVFDKTCKARSIPFSELAKIAHLNQVSLSASGFYKTPGIWFDRETGKGKPFHYYSFGMAVSEVVLDTLTGSCDILRSDILHDVGDSLDPAIDLGQVEGAFIQGVGWCTTEEIKWDDQGRLLTHSPDTYKIPTVGNIPKDFRVDLLKAAPNPLAIRNSKAVGEPPFMLAFSVWLAIRDAITAATGRNHDFEFTLPATPEAVLLEIERHR